MPSSTAASASRSQPVGLDRVLHRELLRDLIREQIFCPDTRKSLSLGRSVGFQVNHTATGRLVMRTVVAADAYDRSWAEKVAQCEALEEYDTVVYDGRILFGRRR
jgi:hypothetical protein